MTSASVFSRKKYNITECFCDVCNETTDTSHTAVSLCNTEDTQYILLKKKRGLLLNMTISLDTGLLPGHCSSLPKRSERRKALYKSEESFETSRNLSDQTFCNTCNAHNAKVRYEM